VTTTEAISGFFMFRAAGSGNTCRTWQSLPPASIREQASGITAIHGEMQELT
jgi:hypothetical protein